MGRLAILIGVTLTIVGLTSGTDSATSGGPSRPTIRFEDDTKEDKIESESVDPIETSGSRHQPLGVTNRAFNGVTNSHHVGGESFKASHGSPHRSSSRSSHGTSSVVNVNGEDGEEYHLSESNSRPFRRRAGGRRRRPLDPERRRQLLLRRQKLGLPIPKFLKDDAFRRRQKARTESPPLTTTDEFMERVSVLMSTPNSGTVRVFPDAFTTTKPTTTPAPSTTTSRFPSFSAASRLRQRFKTIRDEWGLKTKSESEEELETTTEKQERRGRVPSRSRLVTTSTRGTNNQDKRLRYRPVLVRKKLRSRVKVTSPAPDFPPSDDPPVLDPIPIDYQDDGGIYEPGTQDYNFTPSEPSRHDPYEPDPYYFSTEPPIYETVTKPRHTPVPKKVALDPVTLRPKKRFHESSASFSDTRFHKSKNAFNLGARIESKGITPIPLGPDLTPTPTPEYFSEETHVTQPTYAPEPTQAPEPLYRQEPVYVPEPTQAPEPLYHQEPVYAPEPVYHEDPAYATEEVYSPQLSYEDDPAYAPQPAYAFDPAYVDEPEYAPQIHDLEEYSDEDYEDGPGIFDQYKYGYSVASKDTGNYHARSEARDGETVSGSYKVALPDGRVQTVTYVADDNGFRAEVNYDGEAVEQDPPTASPSPPAHSPPTSPSPSKSHHRASPHEDGTLFRQHISHDDISPIHPEDHFDDDVGNFRPSPPHPFPRRTRFQAKRPRTLTTQSPNPRPHRLRPVPRPIHHHPFDKPATLVPHLEEDLTPTQAPRPINQNLHFHDAIHVTTPSPNPFRLVVEKSRASTFAPPIRSASIKAFRNAMILKDAHHLASTTLPTTPSPNAGTFTPTYDATEQHTTPPTTTFSPVVATFKPLDEGESFSTTTLPPTTRHKPAISHSNFYQTAASISAHSSQNSPFTESSKSETTNAHTMRPPHSPTEAPGSPNLYEYPRSNVHTVGREAKTILYNPDPKSAAYIHALGRTHAVPILLPIDSQTQRSPFHHRSQLVTTSTPRTYYLNTPAVVFPGQHSTPSPQVVRMIKVTPAPPVHFSSAEGVEIVRGDAFRKRLTLKVPEPHEADIYPTPRPRIMIL